MTERQQQIFMVISEWWKMYGYAPSIDDIMNVTGDRSRGNVHRMMVRLCDLGLCKRLPNVARSIRPVHIRVRDL
jgi:SOS-response transcriptional repressor LexA